MCFMDALNCCCSEDDDSLESIFGQPNLYRYMNAPLLDARFDDYTGGVDLDVEKTKTGVKVTSVSYPLIPEPDYMGLSGLKPLCSSQQAADQQKYNSKNEATNRHRDQNNDQYQDSKANNHGHRSSEDPFDSTREQRRDRKTSEESHRQRQYRNTPQWLRH